MSYILSNPFLCWDTWDWCIVLRLLETRLFKNIGIVEVNVAAGVSVDAGEAKIYESAAKPVTVKGTNGERFCHIREKRWKTWCYRYSTSLFNDNHVLVYAAITFGLTYVPTGAYTQCTGDDELKVIAAVLLILGVLPSQQTEGTQGGNFAAIIVRLVHPRNSFANILSMIGFMKTRSIK